MRCLNVLNTAPHWHAGCVCVCVTDTFAVRGITDIASLFLKTISQLHTHSAAGQPRTAPIPSFPYQRSILGVTLLTNVRRLRIANGSLLQDSLRVVFFISPNFLLSSNSLLAFTELLPSIEIFSSPI